MVNVEQYLQDNRIQYILHEHPAVYTCEEMEKYRGNISGIACKNLFLTDKKGKRHFLIMLPAERRADLKEIGKIVGERKVSFASPEALKKKLDLEAGAVSPFGVLNDRNHEVEIYVYGAVYNAAAVSFHPNRNTASLELTGEMFRKFLQTLENSVQVIQ